MTRDEQIARIERDRKEREAALLLLLLSLSTRTRRNVARAIRTGGDWRAMVAATLLGSEALDLPGGVGFMSAVMADSHRAAVVRVGRLVGVDVSAGASADDLIAEYQARAREALERIRGALEGAVADALSGAVAADSIHADVIAAGGAFRVSGFAPDNPYGAQAEATAAVTSSYAVGMAEGFGNADVRAVTEGLVFINPMDNRTTQICRKRHGVTLHHEDGWWLRNWPPLHWGPCRSVVLPVTRKVVFTPDPPEFPPPDPGWGRWAGMLSAFQTV